MQAVLDFVNSHYILTGSVYLFIGLMFSLVYLALNSVGSFAAGLAGVVVNAVYREKVFPTDRDDRPSLVALIFCLLFWPLIPVYLFLGLIVAVIKGIASFLKEFLSEFSEFKLKEK